MWSNCGASSRPTRRSRGISSASAASATGSSHENDTKTSSNRRVPVTCGPYSRSMEITRMHLKTRQLTLAALLLTAAGLAQQRRQQDIDLQAAIRKETIEGDLNGAIKQYAAI